MTDLVIRGGLVIDAGGERRADVVVSGGTIAAVGEGLDAPIVLDAGGCVVTPGFVDLSVRLGEPGRAEAETVESACRSAALGGFTAIVAQPDGEVVADSTAVVRELRMLAEGAMCDVEVAGAITVDAAGARLAPMGELAAIGVRLFTDGGGGVQDDRLMRRALQYAGDLGVTVVQRPESASLAAGGHVHEGAVSSRLGIPGIPAEAEEVMVMRDVALCRMTGGALHFARLSAAGSLAMVRAARSAGMPITVSVTPHHLARTDDDVAGYDPAFKVSPPLRTVHDRAALRAGLVEGIVDAIASDHHPIEAHLVEVPFDEAEPGVVGLETALAVSLTELDAPISRILAALSWQPAAIAGVADVHGGPIEAGRPANIAVVDPTVTWTVDAAATASRSRNSMFHGATVRGRVRHTVRHGEPVVVDGEAQR